MPVRRKLRAQDLCKPVWARSGALARAKARSFLLTGALIASCSPTPESPPPSHSIGLSVLDVAQVVPSPGLPPEVVPQFANNNLDIVWHDERLYLAFRTAPSHFASPDVVLYVVSTEDQENWRFEGRFERDTDIREPQLFSWRGELFLYFAVLGDNALDFEPQGSMYTRYEGPGEWEEPTWFPDETFIPWRIKVIDETLHMIGYTGGAGVYDVDAAPIEVRWLTSVDGVDWSPVGGNGGTVLMGGGSETDFVIRTDGSLVAVVRNEAGDEAGYGSKICRAEAEALTSWECAADKRKFDSPLVFQNGDDVWLVARRNVTETGNYDLEREDLPPEDQYLHYQVNYWNAPKRCSLWSVDPDRLEVTFVLDLPSRGDTCFPEAVELEGGKFLIYNYTSPLEGPDVTWLEGQTGETAIYRQVLAFE